VEEITGWFTHLPINPLSGISLTAVEATVGVMTGHPGPLIVPAATAYLPLQVQVEAAVAVVPPPEAAAAVADVAAAVVFKEDKNRG
jgi:hypothetical protein